MHEYFLKQRSPGCSHNPTELRAASQTTNFHLSPQSFVRILRMFETEKFEALTRCETGCADLPTECAGVDPNLRAVEEGHLHAVTLVNDEVASGTASFRDEGIYVIEQLQELRCPATAFIGIAGAIVRANLTFASSNFWRVSDIVVGGHQWCRAHVPDSSWSLSCKGGLRAKVLTYNLFWWNLFGLRGGEGRRSGRLIASTAWPDPYDFMGFQECDDIERVVHDAGLQNEYTRIQGPHALGVAYRKATWQELGRGQSDIAEDRRDQWYGQRAVQWVRVKHRQNSRTVLFLNFHGPLPLSSGGKCGCEATAYNIMRVIGENAESNDDVILVGDFNSVTGSPTIQKLSERMHRVFSGNSHGGVDHIFSSCPSVKGTWNLGTGGSDHDALSLMHTIELCRQEAEQSPFVLTYLNWALSAIPDTKAATLLHQHAVASSNIERYDTVVVA
ncbi:unnamed protein product [Symbiodinium microadriaticum]|nr:unnamed protein product [Symbiodinium microadriaticum]